MATQYWMRVKIADGRASEGLAENPADIVQTVADNTGLLVFYKVSTGTVKKPVWPDEWIEVYPQGTYSWEPPGYVNLNRD